MKLKNNVKKVKKEYIKNNKEVKLIISHEPDRSFDDDFVDFVQDILDYD